MTEIIHKHQHITTEKGRLFLSSQKNMPAGFTARKAVAWRLGNRGAQHKDEVHQPWDSQPAGLGRLELTFTWEHCIRNITALVRPRRNDGPTIPIAKEPQKEEQNCTPQRDFLKH